MASEPVWLYLWTIVAFLACAFATTVNALRAKRAGPRRPFYALVALVALYNMVIYGLALLGILPIRDIGPDYLRGSNIALMGILGAFALAYWRSDG